MRFATHPAVRRAAAVLTVVLGIAAVSATALTVLFGLDYAGLISLQGLEAYPIYRLG